MITVSDPVAGLLHLFAKRIPNVGRLQLASLVYLADVAARSYLGEPITDLEYICYDNGPFESRIYSRLSRLVRDKAVDDHSTGDRYVATEVPDGSWLTERQSAVVDYVIAEFGCKALPELLASVAATPPMKLAIDRRSVGQPLDMETIPDQTAVFESVRRGVEQLDRGEGVPFSQVYPRKRTG